MQSLSLVTPCAFGSREAEEVPQVLSWQMLDGQLMHVSLAHGEATFAGTLMLEPRCAPGTLFHTVGLPVTF